MLDALSKKKRILDDESTKIVDLKLYFLQFEKYYASNLKCVT